MSKPSRSKNAVAAIMRSRTGIKTKGFAAELRRRWGDNEEIHEAATHVIPDAWEIIEDERIVVMIEVIDDNPIRQNKADAIFQLALALDDVEWHLNVACFDYEANLIGVANGFSFSPAYLETRHPNPRNVLPSALRIQDILNTPGEATKEQLQAAVDKLAEWTGASI